MHIRSGDARRQCSRRTQGQGDVALGLGSTCHVGRNPALAIRSYALVDRRAGPVGASVAVHRRARRVHLEVNDSDSQSDSQTGEHRRFSADVGVREAGAAQIARCAISVVGAVERTNHCLDHRSLHRKRPREKYPSTTCGVAYESSAGDAGTVIGADGPLV